MPPPPPPLGPGRLEKGFLPVWPGHHAKGCLGLTDPAFSSHTAGASLHPGCLTCPSAGGLAWRSPNLGASDHRRARIWDQLKEAALSRQARNGT